MTELHTTTQILLSATAPYDLECSLRAIAGFRPGLHDVGLLDGMVRRAFTHPSDPQSAVVTQVTERDDGAPGVRLTVFSESPLGERDLEAVGARVSSWLGLDDERAEFLRIAEGDERVRPLLEVAAGLHQPRFSSLPEAVVYFTLVQNSTEWYAALRKRRLTVHLGPTGRVAGEDYTAFPEFALLTRLTPEHLAPFVGMMSKATRLAEVIAGVAALDEELLRHGPYEDARAALLSVRGVGEYTAHALLMRALGRPDAAPLEMNRFVSTAVSVYGDPPPTPAELRERYGPWVGWWAYTCRTAVGWLEQDRKARERAERQRQRAGSTRRPRTPGGSTRPRATGRGRTAAPWSPSDPGPGAVELEAHDTTAAAGKVALAAVDQATPAAAGIAVRTTTLAAAEQAALTGAGQAAMAAAGQAARTGAGQVAPGAVEKAAPAAEFVGG
ncbi:DNA-3-methyladenine glycosylase family protein [Dactylosporangium darangshiense]|uniref:HhH-GPD domain-containing protein n=1 Tax=Dactylosporangium darangshiense TaxID=579108 RepID=A0ABP8D4I8_9ACTN